MDIYHIKGQVVKSLYKGGAETGNHTVTWNGLDNSGKECTSGVYFYRLSPPPDNSGSKNAYVKVTVMLVGRVYALPTYWRSDETI